MQVLRTSVRNGPHRLIRNTLPVLQPAQWRNRNNRKNPKLQARWSDRRQILSVVLLAFGGVLCAYVAGSYTWMYLAQKKLLHEFKTQQSAGEILTKISIPRIGLRAVVIEGTSGHSLLLGPGHMTGSASPGTLGNSVIAGHRDTFFRHIQNLKNGDSVYILRSGKRFHYVVFQRKVVQPTDLSVLQASKTGELTLITCYPTHFIGPAPQRLIIVAKLAGSSAQL
jgi:LPXTG-site transpeptidase (sortase) family protein